MSKLCAQAFSRSLNTETAFVFMPALSFPPGARATAAAPSARVARAGGVTLAPRPHRRRALPPLRAAPRDDAGGPDARDASPAFRPDPDTATTAFDDERSLSDAGVEEDAAVALRPPGPEPDAAAFANVVVSVALVSAAGWVVGVDPWSMYGHGPLAPALLAGVACAPLLTGFYGVVRLALGGVWWSELEGQGALATLSPPRVAAWSAAVALADGALVRGLVLALLSSTLTRPGGTLDADATGWTTAADAAISGAAGSLVPLVALPPSWFAPALALATGAVAAAASCWEPLAPITAGFVADDGGDLNMRELLWAWWRDDDDEEEEGGYDGGGRPPVDAPPSPAPAAALADDPATADTGYGPLLSVHVSAAARRWPHGDGAVRSVALPALVLAEATSLTVETLATQSLLASVVTHALALGALCAMEVANGPKVEE